MKNLEKLGVQSLSTTETREIQGGIFPPGFYTSLITEAVILIHNVKKVIKQL
ncbi:MULTISPECIES: hypothetical protein [Aquimarina]|uniref:hypothetical protein n=1 Tax=Aquimarina TaxID=290174 RepID=UPI00131F3FF0|nr:MULTISPECIES: hypothetical protein [Aquimarina]